MQIIGVIKFVQIQQEPLKEYLDDGTRRYNPKSLLKLKRIQLTPDGIIGLTDTDDQILDVHNLNHPNSRHRGDNPISIGFTSHYEKMRAKLGNHLEDGIAGESIIVETTKLYTPKSLSGQLAIQLQNDNTLIYLDNVIPAPPCEPFSRFASGKNLSAKEMKTTLQFLSNGTRGFYAKLKDTDSAVIQAGDQLVQVTD